MRKLCCCSLLLVILFQVIEINGERKNKVRQYATEDDSRETYFKYNNKLKINNDKSEYRKNYQFQEEKCKNKKCEKIKYKNSNLEIENENKQYKKKNKYNNPNSEEIFEKPRKIKFTHSNSILEDEKSENEYTKIKKKRFNIHDKGSGETVKGKFKIKMKVDHMNDESLEYVTNEKPLISSKKNNIKHLEETTDEKPGKTQIFKGKRNINKHSHKYKFVEEDSDIRHTNLEDELNRKKIRQKKNRLNMIEDYDSLDETDKRKIIKFVKKSNIPDFHTKQQDNLNEVKEGEVEENGNNINSDSCEEMFTEDGDNEETAIKCKNFKNTLKSNIEKEESCSKSHDVDEIDGELDDEINESDASDVPKRKSKYSIKFSHEKQQNNGKTNGFVKKLHKGDKYNKKYGYEDEESSEEDNFPKRFHYEEDDEY